MNDEWGDGLKNVQILKKGEKLTSCKVTTNCIFFLCRNMLRGYGIWTVRYTFRMQRHWVENCPSGACSDSFKTLHLFSIQCLTNRAYNVAFIFCTSRQLYTYIHTYILYITMYICLWNISCGNNRLPWSVTIKWKKYSILIRAFHLRDHVSSYREWSFSVA